MTDYPLIDPADVREGDEIEMTYSFLGHVGTVRGVAWRDEMFGMQVGATFIDNKGLTDLRLVHRPAPPEPALRVGDWVRRTSGEASQIINFDHDGDPIVRYGIGCIAWKADVTRIEPPVGWPVAVPDPDAPGGVRWWVKYHRTSLYLPTDASSEGISWPELVAAGGVPALAPEGSK